MLGSENTDSCAVPKNALPIKAAQDGFRSLRLVEGVDHPVNRWRRVAAGCPLGTVSFFTAPGLRDRDPMLQGVVVVGGGITQGLCRSALKFASVKILMCRKWLDSRA